MQSIEEHGKKVCLYLKNSFRDEKPIFSRYWDSHNQHPIDIATWHNFPVKSFSTILTVNLSYYPLIKYGEIYDKGKAEFLCVCNESDCEIFRRILATCGYCVINGKYFCCPRAIFPDVISVHNIATEMKHVFFEKPFLFPEDLSCATIAGTHIEWLSLVPISDAEYRYAIDHSVEALGDLLEEKQIEYWDLERQSVV